MTPPASQAQRRRNGADEPAQEDAPGVWSEGKGPADGRLTVRDVTREDLDVVAHWELD